jgi:hypothetical protein
MVDHTMTLQEIIEDIHAMTQECEIYERKYGVLSETFYKSYTSGEEPEHEDWVMDWTDWAGAYKILLRRRIQYQQIIDQLRGQLPTFSTLVERTSHREPIRFAA